MVASHDTSNYNISTKHMLKVHQYNVSCASSISQYAALEALTNGLIDPETMKETYRTRRDFVYNRLIDIGLTVNKPTGAFYLFPEFPKSKFNSFELGIDLVKRGRVAIVPGGSFTHLGEGYMRLSYAYDMKTLEEGLNRIESYVQDNF